MATKRASAKSEYGPEIVGFTAYVVKKGEGYMSKKQLGHFHVILSSWREQLLGTSETTVHNMQGEKMNFPDPLDRAALEEEYSLELRTRDRERKFIKKVDESLDDIETGEYGYCEDCGAEIGIRRLEARPTATQCIDCKTFDEIRERQTVV